jgi:hypothetical protein
VTFFDVITKIDLTIIVGIIVSHNFSRDVIDIFTVPSTWAFRTDIWGGTIEVTIVWAVFISPVIFTDNNTFIDFTTVNRSVSVLVTGIHDHI